MGIKELLPAAQMGEYYAESPDDRKKLPLTMRKEVQQLTWDTTPREFSATHHLPPILDYEPDSASLPPTTVTRTITGTQLIWTWPAPPPTAAYSVTYRTRPLAEGTGDITGGATIVGADGSRQLIPMPSRPITVSGLCITPSAEPTNTDTPTPTQAPTSTTIPTATWTATATASPTATPTPGPVYLPLLLKTEACIPETRNADVVLVIDTSNSMSETTRPGGPTKLAAARDAATAFVGQLALGRDQAAVIQFNSAVTVLAGLTPDPAAASAALGRLTQGGGTRIDLGLEAARAELTGAARRAANNPVLILLTDGTPSGTTPEEVRAAAARAKAEGILVFTIGLGLDVDAGLLTDIASRPAWYFAAPDTGDLAAIYGRIVTEIPCQPQWP